MRQPVELSEVPSEIRNAVRLGEAMGSIAHVAAELEVVTGRAARSPLWHQSRARRLRLCLEVIDDVTRQLETRAVTRTARPVGRRA